MTVRQYSSGDASAPTLQGVVGGVYSSGWADGSLLNLLEKILVTGYGSKTAAGWATTYTGTSKGVFTQGGGNGFKLRVLDDGSATAGAREAIVRGYESMSDVDTGTGINSTGFPAGVNLFWRKSDTADSTQRQWMAWADNKTLILFMAYKGTTVAELVVFGDIYSFKSGDAYHTVLIGRATSATLDASTNSVGSQVGNTGSAIAGHFIARNYLQSGGSATIVKTDNPHTVSGGVSDIYMGNSGVSAGFPNPADGRALLTRLYVHEPGSLPANSVRGFMRGLWGIMHSGGGIPMSYSFSGTGSLAGRSFFVTPFFPPAGTSTGRYIVETSDTWD